MMEYLITFLEGIVSFISPCMLPMLPIYIGYFAGVSKDGKRQKSSAFWGALAFVAGFTVVFCLLGTFAGTVGHLLVRYKRWINLICGVIVILLGITFMKDIPLPFLRGIRRQWSINGILSAFLFGMIFSISLTPCVGVFLGAALMLASSSGGTLKGASLLFVYSLGMGIPFVLSAVLIDRLKYTFDHIKMHYKIINIVCGCFLIVVGFMMAMGWLNRLLSVLACF